MTNFLANTFEKLLFHPVTVTSLERVGESFYLASMQGEGIRGVTWIPGQTIQFLVGSLTKRAYTPMDVNPETGTGNFLFYRHGQGPASAWAASLQEGDQCKLMRPKNSIDFTKEDGPALFFGDETSFAAAQTLQQCRGKKMPAHFIFEVNSSVEAQTVVTRLGLNQVTLFQKVGDDSHLENAAHELNRLASALDAPAWFFTGRAPSIQVVRKLLKAQGVSLSRGAVKAYWSPGKRGID
jgi:ferric-chelate reductase (NADPH)